MKIKGDLEVAGRGLDISIDGVNIRKGLPSIVFSGENFYLTNTATGDPCVNYFTGTEYVEYITDGTREYLNKEWLKFNGTDFYLSDDLNGEPVVNLINITGEANTASNIGSGSNSFKQKSGVDLEFRSIIGGDGIDATENTNDITLAVDSTVAKLTDVGPGFYGIVVKDDSTDVVTDSILFSGSDFNVSSTGDGAQVDLDATVAHLSDLPPGFYGINVGQSDDISIFSGIETVKFNIDDFYVTQNDPNTDEVMVNFRGVAAGAGESNTASNKTGDEGVFFQKTDVDLEFKSLTAGTDISLSSTDNAITINSTASGGDPSPGFYGIVVKDDSTTVVTDSILFSGSDFNVSASGDGAQVDLDATVAHLSDLPPGFYGITVKHSDDSESFSNVNLIAFSDDFYITQNVGNTDEVHVNLRINEEISTSITVETVTATEDIIMFFTDKAITVKAIYGVVRGTSSPDVTFIIRHHTDRSNAGNNICSGSNTVDSTTVYDIFSPDGDATIPGNSFVWLETSAITGTVDEMSLTITYTED